ncbi:hypothetical protein LTR17_027403 [Elasticomyces elasticus]|nr:hypothetical protein LTR17_027403 [Elasticomyces elasticus]
MAGAESKTWLIVGASRGIGHEFVSQLLKRGDRVLATVRKPTEEHAITYWTDTNVDPSHCTTLKCDVLSEESIDSCVAELAKVPQLRLDQVVINAGVLKYPNHATGVSYADLAHHLHTNTIGPIIFAQRLLKANIPIGTITFISSDSASMGDFREHEDGFAAYGTSKAALNMMARHMAAELKRKGSSTTILLVHPGEVKTDMAKIEGLDWEVEGQMEPQES